METESLRPELQLFASSPQILQHEITNHHPSVSQLKQEPTVNHQPLQPNPNPSASAPEKHPRSAVHPASPPSDHPITQTPDPSQSPDPKPSSDSTDPLPPLPTPKQHPPHPKKVPSASVRTTAEQPVSQPDTPHNLDNTPLPSRPNTFPLSLLPFPFYDDETSDEDEDFRRYYRAFFRRKTQSEMASPPQAQTPVVVEQPKKPRNTRQSNTKVQKRKTKEAIREIPFSDQKYHKMVGPMVLRPSDIARDLAKIYGREYKEPASSAAKPPLRPGDRKRQRGCDSSGTGNSVPQNKRARQGSANSADVGDKNVSSEAGRLTRYAKRSSAQAGISNGERGNHGGNKRTRTGGSPGSVGENDVKKLFTKHPDKKGWVVCKRCSAAVWPPNCGKHVSHCRSA